MFNDIAQLLQTHVTMATKKRLQSDWYRCISTAGTSPCIASYQTLSPSCGSGSATNGQYMMSGIGVLGSFWSEGVPYSYENRDPGPYSHGVPKFYDINSQHDTKQCVALRRLRGDACKNTIRR